MVDYIEPSLNSRNLTRCTELIQDHLKKVDFKNERDIDLISKALFTSFQTGELITADEFDQKVQKLSHIKSLSSVAQQSLCEELKGTQEIYDDAVVYASRFNQMTQEWERGDEGQISTLRKMILQKVRGFAQFFLGQSKEQRAKYLKERSDHHIERDKKQGLMREFAQRPLRKKAQVLTTRQALEALELEYIIEESGLKSSRNESLPLLEEDRLIASLIAKDPYLFSKYIDFFHDSKAAVLTAVQTNSRNFELASSDLQNDVDFVLQAFRINREILVYANPDILPAFFRSIDQTEALAAAELDGSLLQYMTDEQRENRFIVSKALGSEPEALRFASDALRDDAEIVSLSVSGSGEALRYASARLQNDRHVVAIAVGHDGRALRFAGQSMRKSLAIVLLAVQQNVWSLQWASPELQNYKYSPLLKKLRAEFPHIYRLYREECEAQRLRTVQAVAQDWSLLKTVNHEFQNDEEVVLAACKRSAEALQFASQELKGYRSFVMKAVSMDGKALKYASATLKDDLQVVKKAILNDPSALQFASDRLKNNEELALMAMLEGGLDALQFASVELRNSFHKAQRAAEL